MCSECGAEWEWADVLDPANLGPRWSFEHGRRPSLARWVRASMTAFRPAHLWRTLPRDGAPRWGRLAAFGAVWLILMHAAALAIAGAWADPYSGPPWWAWPYGGTFRIPTPDPNHFYVAEFATLAAMVWGLVYLPCCLLVGLALLPAFRAQLPALGRAGLLLTPVAAVGLLVAVGHFVGGTWLEARRASAGGSTAMRVLFLSTLLVFPGWSWWWWRSFFAHGARTRWPSLGATLLLVPSVVGTFLILDWIES